MENHPIPQDVTGFQFKLIGEMTVKQFAYIAAGVVFAWIMYVLPLTIFLKAPLMILCAGTGFALAFLPVEGRPLDIIFYHFIKALFIPNQYVYQKIGGVIDIALSPQAIKKAAQPATAASAPLESYIQKMRVPVAKTPLDEKELRFFQSLFGSAQRVTQPTIVQPMITTAPLPHVSEPKKEDVMPKETPVLVAAPQPSIQTSVAQPAMSTIQINQSQPIQVAPQPTNAHFVVSEDTQKKEKELQDTAESIKNELYQTQKQEATGPKLSTEDMHQKVLELEKRLNEVLSQKDQLEQQVIALGKRVATQPQQDKGPRIRKISQGASPTLGLSGTEAPNLVAGIVKDPRGNVLPNILIEIKDKDGNPVRAFKTNSLGQFASATPLSNGTYTIVFEDPSGKNKFDLIELATTGQIIPPVEVISSDEREELRRELFGQ